MMDGCYEWIHFVCSPSGNSSNVFRMCEAVSSSTSKYKRRALSVETQFERLQAQWKNGQSGTGAWFWRHFKPVLLTVHEGAKELQLQCQHCSKLFSARNPSRTSLEHLKSGACVAFRRTAAYEEVKAAARSSTGKRNRKHARVTPHTDATPLSGEGRGPTVERGSLETTDALIGFFLESGVPASLAEHPRMIELCQLIGAPRLEPRQILSVCLDARFDKVVEENEARMRKAGLYQIAAQGSRSETLCITLNFAEGPPAFLRWVDRSEGRPGLTSALTSAIEELDVVVDRRNCIGWIADVDPSHRVSLSVAEETYPWMVHMTCQMHALRSLIADLIEQAKVVGETVEMAQRIVRFFASNATATVALRTRFPDALLREMASPHPVVSAAEALESVWTNRSPLQTVCAEEPIASDEAGSVVVACLDVHFWECAGAVQSLLTRIVATLRDMKASQPHLSQAMDVWIVMERHFADWCRRNGDISAGVMEIFEKRFRESYHPAMAAAFLLDPGFCARRDDGSFAPDWEILTPEQQSDVSVVLKRVSAPNRGTKIASELARWKSEGFLAEYGSVVSDRAPVGDSCLCRCVPMALRKTIWNSCLKDLEALVTAAHRLLALRATAIGPLGTANLSGSSSRAHEKLLYLQNNSRLSNGRFEEERLLDLDIVAELAALPDEKSLNRKEPMDESEPPKHEIEAGSHLYMHQLQLSTPPPPVLRMTPPPLGTMPELPLHLPMPTTFAVVPATPKPEETQFFPDVQTSEQDPRSESFDNTEDAVDEKRP